MAQDKQLRERYSNLVLAKLRSKSLFPQLFNTKYDGDPTAGAVNIPVRDTEVPVNDYDKVNGAALTNTTTSYKILVTDIDNVVNELIDGYTAAGVPDNLFAERLDSAGYSMALKVDIDLANELITNGTAIEDTKALTKTSIYEAIIDARTVLRKKHVSTSEMWLAVSPETYSLILKSPDFIKASALGDAVVQTGAVGQIGGILVYEADNLTDDKVEFVLGNRIFCHYVAEWKVPIYLIDLQDEKHVGASAVKGRQVYGKMISRPETVLVKKHV